ATAFALSVVRPGSCGLGGGGFMVIWNAKTQQAVTLDYRERAPKQATRNMFVDKNNPAKTGNALSRKGHLAFAVPGTVAGLCYAQKQYGRLTLKTVLQPAIRLAKAGIHPDAHQRSLQKSTLREFRNNPEHRKRFQALYEKYLNSGKEWKADDRFHSPLLEVLEQIAERGSDGFYRGPVARALVAESRRGGGLLTPEDLASMQPVVRKPMKGRFDSLEIISMPPPSSGGVALLESLNILSAYEREHPNQRIEKLGLNTPAYLHLLTEAMKHSFADRAAFLGDADFANVPVERLIRRSYAERLAAKIDVNTTKPLKEYGRFLPVDDAGTSHFSIIDHQGNAVACTETINTGFGSYVVEPKYGIVLNNQMDDFAAVPGQPNAFGLIQSEANSVQPGKKPLSSMTPTIVIKDGKAVFALGASGGPRIISSTLQVLLNMTRFGMSPAEAVNQPRIHHQWLPNTLFVEEPLFETVRKPLEQRKHSVARRNNLAAVQAVSRRQDGLRGASQPSKHGKPAGY
ncbi:MAG: gamma-glutamyltransferase, partial [Planctomycetes bacterium]|nr:gamma-glutamyltransferase [Planctomycetota bacterium]